MTDEVAGLVLRNNYLQTLALSLAERRGLGRSRLRAAGSCRRWKRQGRLDRAVEYLPDDAALAERDAARRGADAAGTRGAARLCQARAAR